MVCDKLRLQARRCNLKKIVIGPEVVKWVALQTNEYGNFGCATGIGLQEGGRIIAGVAYAEWNGVNVVCHIASDKTRRWANREFLRVIFDYPFNQMKAKRITVCIGQGNKDSIRFVEHLGFRFETHLKDAHPTGNLLIYTMGKPHAERWLRLKASHELLAA